VLVAHRALLIPLSTNYSAQLDRIISTCAASVSHSASISPIAKVIKIRRAPFRLPVCSPPAEPIPGKPLLNYLVLLKWSYFQRSDKCGVCIVGFNNII
jgi:hypothetical protein